jgi:hypothetical protein
MKQEYEIDKRYPWDAEENSVCPLPDGMKVTIWFDGSTIENVIVTRNSQKFNWSRVTHFMVHEYPEEPVTFWMNFYGKDGFGGFKCEHVQFELHNGKLKILQQVEAE